MDQRAPLSFALIFVLSVSAGYAVVAMPADWTDQKLSRSCNDHEYTAGAQVTPSYPSHLGQVAKVAAGAVACHREGGREAGAGARVRARTHTHTHTHTRGREGGIHPNNSCPHVD